MQSIGLLFKVLWSPGEAMFLLSKNPRVFVPLAFFTLASLISAIVIQTKAKIGDLIVNLILRSPQAAQMPDQAKNQLQDLMHRPFISGAFYGMSMIGPIAIVLIVALCYFGVFSMVGREGGFKAFLSITAFAFVPSVLGSATAAVRALTVPSSSLMLDEIGSLSPATFLDRDTTSTFVFAAVNSIDLVTIWILALLVIGFGFLTRKGVSAGARTAAVLSLYFLYKLITIGPLALQR